VDVATTCGHIHQRQVQLMELVEQSGWVGAGAGQDVTTARARELNPSHPGLEAKEV